MAKRAKPEEIIAKLREVSVRVSQGESEGKAVTSHRRAWTSGIIEVDTDY